MIGFGFGAMCVGVKSSIQNKKNSKAFECLFKAYAMIDLLISETSTKTLHIFENSA